MGGPALRAPGNRPRACVTSRPTVSALVSHHPSAAYFNAGVDEDAVAACLGQFFVGDADCIAGRIFA